MPIGVISVGATSKEWPTSNDSIDTVDDDQSSGDAITDKMLCYRQNVVSPKCCVFISHIEQWKHNNMALHDDTRFQTGN